MRIDLYHGLYIQYDLIYAVRNLTVSCCVGGLCFFGGRKTRVHYVCPVLIVRKHYIYIYIYIYIVFFSLKLYFVGYIFLLFTTIR